MAVKKNPGIINYEQLAFQHPTPFCAFLATPFPCFSQQTMAHYEGGSLRIAVALLKPLAKALAVSFEELIDEPVPASKKKRGPSSKLQQQIEQIQQLPRTKQKFVMEMLDTVLQQAS